MCSWYLEKIFITYSCNVHFNYLKEILLKTCYVKKFSKWKKNFSYKNRRLAMWWFSYVEANRGMFLIIYHTLHYLSEWSGMTQISPFGDLKSKQREWKQIFWVVWVAFLREGESRWRCGHQHVLPMGIKLFNHLSLRVIA